MKRASVILIRESQEQLTGSGCCGRLEGDFLSCGDGTPVFEERRAAMESMGPLYRGLRSRYADAIDLQVVDPRNIGLFFMLLRDFWTHRVGPAQALRTLVDLPVRAVTVNGRIVAKGEWPSLEDVAAVLEREGVERVDSESGARISGA